MTIVTRWTGPAIRRAHAAAGASEAEIGQAGVIIGSPAERPAVLPIGFGDRQVVDAGVAPAHEAALVEFPVLVAVGAEPGTASAARAFRAAVSAVNGGKGGRLDI